MIMKIYLLSQSERTGYDTYDSCVVCAENAEDAKTIKPDESEWDEDDNEYGTWASSPANVNATEIGTANLDQIRGVIISSFNAG